MRAAMRRSILQVFAALVAAVLYSATLAGAAQIPVTGTGHADAFSVFFVSTAGQISPEITPTPVGTVAGPWVAGSWITFDNTNQSWPMTTGSGNLPGTYHYLLRFTMAGLDATTAYLKGSWASDNGSDLLFNGTPVGTTSGYSSLTGFELTSGFLDGDNVLQFVVVNDPYGDAPYTNPTGLLVNIDEASADPVPEPSTLILLGGGLFAVGVARRRSRS